MAKYSLKDITASQAKAMALLTDNGASDMMLKQVQAYFTMANAELLMRAFDELQDELEKEVA